MSPRAPDSPDRSCQEPVSTVRRHKHFPDARKAHLNITAALSTHALIIRTKGIRPYIVSLIISI